MNQLNIWAKLQQKVSIFASICVLITPGVVAVPAIANQTEESSETFYKQAEAELPEQFYVLYRIVERIARANDLDQHHWRVVIPEEYQINAFAREANLIVVYNGLLDQLAGDASALACVVGHEMAHHVHKHIPIYDAEYDEGLEEIYDSEATNPDSNGNEEDSKALEERMAELKRSQEYEADSYGYKYSVKAGFEASGCLRALEVLSRLPGSLRDSSSHPGVPYRIEAIEKLQEKEPPDWLAVIGSREFTNSRPLSYKWSEEEQSLRINSERGGSYLEDLDRLFEQ